MKKWILTIGLFSFITGAHSQVLILTLNGNHFSPTETAFRDIYGCGMMFGGELEVELSRHFSLWLGGKYYTRKGQLSFTREETRLTLVPFDLGVRYKLLTGVVVPYIGSSLVLSRFSESNPIGSVRVIGVGWRGEGGIEIRVINRFLMDLRIDYSISKIDPADIPVDIGGFSISSGLKIDFGRIRFRPKDAPNPWYEDFFERVNKKKNN